MKWLITFFSVLDFYVVPVIFSSTGRRTENKLKTLCRTVVRGAFSTKRSTAFVTKCVYFGHGKRHPQKANALAVRVGKFARGIVNRIECETSKTRTSLFLCSITVFWNSIRLSRASTELPPSFSFLRPT